MRKQGGQIIDLTGQRFGKLVAIEVSHTDKRGALWACACDCGNSLVTVASQLRRGGTRSCGCLRAETYKARVAEAGDGPLWRRCLSAYKNNARQRGHEWTLPDEVASKLLRGSCHYCGAAPSNEMHNGKDRARTISYSGIDRIDNTIGYVVGNVVSCCQTCNLAKRGMHPKAFIAWARRVASHNPE